MVDKPNQPSAGGDRKGGRTRLQWPPRQGRRRLWPSVALLALASAGLVAVGNSASAAVPGLERVTAASVSDSTGVKSVGVACPAGKRVVGAGGEIIGGLGEVLLSEVHPIGNLDQVTAKAHEDRSGYSGNWSVTAYAVCADPLPGLALVKATTAPATSTNPQNVTATCPAGKRLLGTGSGVEGNAVREVGVKFVHPNPGLTAVFVGAYELGIVGTLATWYANAYAICADPIAGLERASATSAANSLSTKNITATCPAPKKATGVGAELGGLLTYGAIEDLKPNGSPPVSATATGYEYLSYSGNWTVTSHVICAEA